MDVLAPLGLVLAFSALGALLGTATGLLPGLHVNNVALLLVAVQVPATAALSSLLPAPLVPLALVAFVLAAAVAHAFSSFVPSVFLGAPEEDTALAVLPAHRMLMRGRGLEAIALAVRGALAGLLLSFVLVLPVRLLLGPPVGAYEQLRWATVAILALVAVLMVLSERSRSAMAVRRQVSCLTPDGLQRDPGATPIEEPALEDGAAVVLTGRVRRPRGKRFLLQRGSREIQVVCGFPPGVIEGDRLRVFGFVGGSVRRSTSAQRALATALLLLSGALGTVVLGSPGLWSGWGLLPISPGQAALLPLFAGLFGVSSLLLSPVTSSVPEQSRAPAAALPLWRRVRALLGGTVAAGAVSAFPAMSGGIATLVARQIADGGEDTGADGSREFLFANGAVNAAMTLFSVVSLFVTGRTRSGAAAAVDTLGGPLARSWAPVPQVPVLLAAVLLAAIVAGALAAPLTLRAARGYARLVRGTRVRRLQRGVIVSLALLTLVIAGPMGLAVLAIATAIGVLPPLLGVRRLHLMGCLLVPVALGALGYL